MKAIVWSEYGAPEDVLEPQEVDEPAVGDDGVLVRIRATTVAGDGWHLVRGLPCLARIATALFAPKKNVTTRSGAIMKRRLSRLAIVSCFFALTTAQLSAQNEEWTRPFPSHRVISNLYTVGTYGLGVFLITTDKGHILINTGLEDSTPLIRENIEAVGFRLEDVKILLTMQAHWDHTAALAEIKQITGAKMLATKDDARVLEDGGFSDAHFGGRESFKPVSVDQIIGEGEVIELGDTRLTVYEHPGHTEGSASYSMRVRENGRDYNVVIANMGTINQGKKLLVDPTYPGVAEDFARTYRSQKTMAVDVWVAAHGGQYGLHDKYDAGQDYDPNTFVDPEGFLAEVERLERLYLEQLAEEQRQ